MEIQPMSPHHIEAVSSIEQACFSLPWSPDAFLAELEAPNAIYLVAIEGGVVLGYGGMRFAAGEFYIDNIAAAPFYRRQGVGRAITSCLVRHARDLGGEFISLEVRPSNLAAKSLYLGLGFRPAGLRKNFYQKPTEDGLIMTLRLKEE